MESIPQGTKVGVFLRSFRNEEGHPAVLVEMGVGGVLLTWERSWSHAYPSHHYVPRKGDTVFYPWDQIDCLKIRKALTQIEEKAHD